MKIVPALCTLLILLCLGRSQYCPRQVMESYFLEGLLMPDESTVPFCPSIKNNCCTPDDMIAVYNKYETELLPKLGEMKDKLLMQIKSTLKLHNSVTKLSNVTFTDPTQEKFCKDKLEAVKNFNMHELLENLQNSFHGSFKYHAKNHKAFLCVFCDYDALKELILPTQTAPVESKMCHLALLETKEFLTEQNVDLVAYFKQLQEALDCLLFEKKFSLPFAFGFQEKLSDDFESCFEELTPDEMNDSCKELCGQLRLGAVSPVFQGDFLFLKRANIFFRAQMSFIKYKANTKAFNPVEYLNKVNKQNEIVRFFNVTDKKAEFRNSYQKPSKFLGLHDSEVADKNPTLGNCNFTKYMADLKNGVTDLPSRIKYRSFTYAQWYANVYLPLCTQKTSGDPTEPVDGRYRVGDTNHVNDLRTYLSSNLDLYQAAKFLTNTTDDVAGAGAALMGGGKQGGAQPATPKRALKAPRSGAAKQAKGTKRKGRKALKKEVSKKAHKRSKQLIAAKQLKAAKATVAKKGKATVVKKGKKLAQKQHSKRQKGAAENLLRKAKKLSRRKHKRSALAAGKKHSKSKAQRKLVDSVVPEKELIAEITEAVEEKLKRKEQLKRHQRRLRVLEETAGEEGAWGVPELHGRVLLEDFVDPRAIEDPQAFFTKWFDSIVFRLNATSLMIHPNVENYPDISDFNTVAVTGQGIDMQDYTNTINFDLSMAEVSRIIQEGSSTEDKLEPEVTLILKACTDKMRLKIEISLEEVYSPSIEKGYFSRDDRDALRLSPKFDKSESFEQVDYKYFSKRVKDRLEHVVSDSFLVQPKISKKQTPLPASYFQDASKEGSAESGSGSRGRGRGSGRKAIL